MPTLSDNLNFDISQAQAVLEKIKGNRVTVWNDNLFLKLGGSIGGVLLLLIMGFVIVIYMYNWKYKNKEMHESNVIVKYNTEIDGVSVDLGCVVACVYRDELEDGEPALLECPGAAHQCW